MRFNEAIMIEWWIDIQRDARAAKQSFLSERGWRVIEYPACHLGLLSESSSCEAVYIPSFELLILKRVTIEIKICS
jgi:hypothetical protein